MQSLVIEGYASLLGVEDMTGDVVRAGAFAQSLSRSGGVGMLLSHVGGRTAGRWTMTREDGPGLFVRGFVSAETAAGRTALRMIRDGTLVGGDIVGDRATVAGSAVRRARGADHNSRKADDLT